jgi:predicted dehydrogenase
MVVEVERLNVGIVGCGLISKLRHIPAYKRMKNKVNLCAVCDLNEALAKEVATLSGTAKAYSNVTDMLSKEDLDIVDICVPPKVHAPVAVEAMENGCNVIMEKPMALKTSDCDLMIQKAEAKGLKLCVIHNDLFHPPFLKAKKIVSEGGIGDFVGMRILLSTPRADMIDLKDHWYHKLPGGVIGETGPHVAYMSLEFLRKVKAADVFARNILGHPWAPYDDFRLELEGEKGISSAVLAYTSDYWAANVDILGTEASLHLNLQTMALIREKLGALEYIPLARYSLNDIYQNITGIAGTSFKVLTGAQRTGTDVVLERFVDSIPNGKLPPVTPDEGREVVRVMEMVVKRYEEKYVGK